MKEEVLQHTQNKNVLVRVVTEERTIR